MEQQLIEIEKEAEDVSSIENLSGKLRAFLTYFLKNISGLLGNFTQKQQTSSFGNLSSDLKVYIVSFLINAENVQGAVENIQSLAATSKEIHSLIHDPQVLGDLIREIGKKFDRTIIDIAIMFKKKGSSWLKQNARQPEKEIVDEHLHEAILEGDTTFTLFLLNSGADVTKVNVLSTTLLICLARRSKDIIEFLLKAGADFNKTEDILGYTPLHIASKEGYKELVEVLLQYGADVNKADNEGKTPLYESISEGHKDVVRLLLQHEADVNKANIKGETPLFTAVSKGYKEIAELLLQYGAAVNKVNEYGQTPFYNAVFRGNKEMVEILLQHGAAVNKAGNNGIMPLFIAVYSNEPDIAELLLQHEAKMYSYFLSGDEFCKHLKKK